MHRQNKDSRPLPRGRLYLLPILLLIASGCNSEPPSANTVADVERLPASAPSLCARGLADGDIPSLARLRDLDFLDFSASYAGMEAKITDEGLARLAKLDLPKFKVLNLGWNNNITDEGLDYLCRMKSLDWLLLYACPHITDAGLSKLANAKNLTYLDLRGCPGVTDVGIQQLAANTNWETIQLGGCPNITAQGVAKLQAALPNARINKDDQEWKWSSQWTENKRK